MKKIIFYSNFICIMFLSISAKAQKDSTVFTLKSCIEYSIKNNLNTVIYANEVEIAKRKKTELLSNMLPQINGSLSFDDNIKKQTTIFPANSFGPNTPESRTQLGSQYTTNGTVQIDQTLYDQSIFLAVGATEVNKQISELKVIQNREDLIYNTSIAYYQILAIIENKKLLLENAKQYNELLTIMKLQYEKGLIKKTDLDRLRVNANNINSQIIVSSTNEKVALNKLKNTMGMSLSDTLRINNSIDENSFQAIPKTENFDVNNKVEYKIVNQNIIIQELDVKQKIAAYYPSLSGYARFGTQALANEFKNATGQWDSFNSIGLKLSVPIFSGLKRKSQLDQTKLTLLNAKENRKLISNNYQLQFQNSSTQLLSSYTSHINNKENLTLAKDVLESIQLQYQKGTASLSDFLNSDYSFKEAQRNYLISLINYLSSKLDNEKAQGTLNNYFQQL